MDGLHTDLTMKSIGALTKWLVALAVPGYHPAFLDVSRCFSSFHFARQLNLGDLKTDSPAAVQVVSLLSRLLVSWGADSMVPSRRRARQGVPRLRQLRWGHLHRSAGLGAS